MPYADRFSNKPAMNSSDIAGSISRPLTHSRNVRDMSLYIDDIDGTRHSIKDRMMRTKRHVNPLVPEYELPTFVPARVPEAPFLRDSMNNVEVEGSTTKPLQKFQMRDTISTNDIVGAQACWRPPHRYDKCPPLSHTTPITKCLCPSSILFSGPILSSSRAGAHVSRANRMIL